jgi:hypothetical protein
LTSFDVGLVSSMTAHLCRESTHCVNNRKTIAVGLKKYLCKMM